MIYPEKLDQGEICRKPSYWDVGYGAVPSPVSRRRLQCSISLFASRVFPLDLVCFCSLRSTVSEGQGTRPVNWEGLGLWYQMVRTFEPCAWSNRWVKTWMVGVKVCMPKYLRRTHAVWTCLNHFTWSTACIDHLLSSGFQPMPPIPSHTEISTAFIVRKRRIWVWQSQCTPKLNGSSNHFHRLKLIFWYILRYTPCNMYGHTHFIQDHLRLILYQLISFLCTSGAEVPNSRAHSRWLWRVVMPSRLSWSDARCLVWSSRSRASA